MNIRQVFNRNRIIRGQGITPTRASADTARHLGRAGTHNDRVRAQACELSRNLILHGIADGHHDNDRHNANNNTQDGQKRPNFISGYRQPGFFKNIVKGHIASLCI